MVNSQRQNEREILYKIEKISRKEKGVCFSEKFEVEKKLFKISPNASGAKYLFVKKFLK